MAGLESERFETFSAAFSGTLLKPGDAGYEEARRVHNGLIDKRPALIARCRAAADVVEAIALARESGLEISVRGGGHSVAGQAVTDGGLMIDLAEMKGICVDPVARTARAQGGVTWGELNRETALHDRWGRLYDGHRRAHARRRAGLAERRVRPRRRQPAFR